MDKIKRARIRLALFAYAYEFKSDSMISDTEFDRLSLELDYTTPTDNKEIDEFFRTEFQPHTGMWIRKHPDIATGKLEQLYQYISRNIKANSRAH